MASLTIALKKTTITLPKPYLYLQGEDSLQVKDKQDLHGKLRTYFDCIEHLKYLDSWSLFAQNDLSLQDRRQLESYAPILKQVIQHVKSSLGHQEDSLVGMEQVLGNIDFILKCSDISHLHIKKPFDAIVLAAGPSLELELEILKKIQNQFLILCCDAVFKRVLEFGIEPHLVVTMERVEDTVPFFENLKSKPSTILVAQPVLKRKILESYPGRIAMVSKYTGIFMWLPFERIKFWAGASCAHLAYKIADALGASRIALVGQDLAFHPETHQSHAKILDYPEWSKERSEKDLRASHPVKEVPGNTYKSVLTSAIWQQFAHEYSVLVHTAKANTVNTSVLGQKIEGLEFQPLEEWVEASRRAPIKLDFPIQNPNQKEETAELLQKWDDTEQQLSLMLTKLTQELSDEKVGTIYRNLFHFKPFLELILEAVIQDFARLEGQIFIHSQDSAAPYQREFLAKVNEAGDQLLKYLKKNREKVQGDVM